MWHIRPTVRKLASPYKSYAQNQYQISPKTLNNFRYYPRDRLTSSRTCTEIVTIIFNLQNFFHANLYKILTQIFLIFCTTTPALYIYSATVGRVWFDSCEDSPAAAVTLWRLFVSTSVYWQTTATETVDSCVTAVCVNICVLTYNSNRTCGQLRDGCLCQHLCTDRQQQQNLWTAAWRLQLAQKYFVPSD